MRWPPSWPPGSSSRGGTAGWRSIDDGGNVALVLDVGAGDGISRASAVEPDVEPCKMDPSYRIDAVRLLAREVILFDLLIPPQINKVLIYPKPISMRWGASKLRSFCADTLGAEPQHDGFHDAPFAGEPLRGDAA
jgi:hypothetical protein